MSRICWFFDGIERDGKPFYGRVRFRASVPQNEENLITFDGKVDVLLETECKITGQGALKKRDDNGQIVTLEGRFWENRLVGRGRITLEDGSIINGYFNTGDAARSTFIHMDQNGDWTIVDDVFGATGNILMEGQNDGSFVVFQKPTGLFSTQAYGILAPLDEDGLPNGQGIKQWLNGDWIKGVWRHGVLQSRSEECKDGKYFVFLSGNEQDGYVGSNSVLQNTQLSEAQWLSTVIRGEDRLTGISIDGVLIRKLRAAQSFRQIQFRLGCETTGYVGSIEGHNYAYDGDLDASGLPDGFGMLREAAGKQSTGYFCRGQKHGVFSVTSSDGVVLELFDNGVPLGSIPSGVNQSADDATQGKAPRQRTIEKPFGTVTEELIGDKYVTVKIVRGEEVANIVERKEDGRLWGVKTWPEGTYEGELDSAGRLNGLGTLQTKDGVFVQGRFCLGVLEAKCQLKQKGVYAIFQAGDEQIGYVGSRTTDAYVYNGELDADGLEHGNGTRTFRTGRVEEGTFAQGVLDGMATVRDGNHWRTAIFRRGDEILWTAGGDDNVRWEALRREKAGYSGRMIGDNFTYEGDLDKDGKPHGDGQLSQQGKKTTGTWEAGVLVGDVLEEWENGDWMRTIRRLTDAQPGAYDKVAARFGNTTWNYTEGRWSVRPSRARITCPEFTYDGEVDFETGARRGKGTTRWTNGDVYAGNVNDRQELSDDYCEYRVRGGVYLGSIHADGAYGVGAFNGQKAAWADGILKCSQ